MIHPPDEKQPIRETQPARDTGPQIERPAPGFSPAQLLAGSPAPERSDDPKRAAVDYPGVCSPFTANETKLCSARQRAMSNPRGKHAKVGGLPMASGQRCLTSGRARAV